MKKSDKIIISIIAVILAFALILVGIKLFPKLFKETPSAKITTASQPFEVKLSEPDKSIDEFYTEKSGDEYPFARNPWDMMTFDGKVYICCGDYHNNSGDTPIFYYDPETDSFEYPDIVYTELASRFYVFDDKLYTTAFDPVAWGLGEFYVKSDDSDEFDYFEALPSNIHCFDMADFDDKFFFCGSVDNYENHSMIQYIEKSDMPVEDFKKTKDIYLYKNGKKLDAKDCYRVYEMFVYNDTLYAWHNDGYIGEMEEEFTGLYVYNKDDCRFDFVGDELTIDPVVSASVNKIDFRDIQQKLVFNSKLVFVSNGLFYTDDLKNYTECNLGKEYDGYIVRDALEIDGQLYLLASQQQNDGTYRTSVFVTEDLENFGEVLYFESESYMISFEYIDKTFVFGEGGMCSNPEFWGEDETVPPTSENCGNLYAVRVE